MSKFKPMLAAREFPDLANLRYPVLVSEKLDGIRAVKRDGRLVSRKLIEIPNDHTRQVLAHAPEGLDGELVVRDGDFNACQSAFMSKSGKPEFTFHVFDWHDQDGLGFHNRHAKLTHPGMWNSAQQQLCDWGIIKVVPHYRVDSMELLLDFEEAFLAAGHEGLMIRDPDGPYKYGRSTLNQGWLLKVKRFADEEATVLAVHPLLRNTNEKKQDELGHAKRSHAKAGMVALETFGTFDLQFDDGTKFSCGGGKGLTAAKRKLWWTQRAELLGTRMTITHQPPPRGRQPGQAPRFPKIKGPRDERDT